MRNEKITVNLSAVELAQIDYLVEKGLFANRADFIRLAIRKQTDEYKKDFEQFLDTSFFERKPEAKIEPYYIMAVWHMGKKEVDEFIRDNIKLRIRLIGSLIVAKDVEPDKFEQIIESAKIYGKVFAEPEIKEILKTK